MLHKITNTSQLLRCAFWPTVGQFFKIIMFELEKNVYSLIVESMTESCCSYLQFQNIWGNLLSISDVTLKSSTTMVNLSNSFLSI